MWTFDPSWHLLIRTIEISSAYTTAQSCPVDLLIDWIYRHISWCFLNLTRDDLSRKERNDLFVIHMCIGITCMYVLYTYIQFYTCNLQYAYHICMYIHTACVYCIYNHPEVDRIWGLFKNSLILVGVYWKFHIISIQGWLYPIVK